MDELQRLIAACEDLRLAVRECCPHAVTEPDPTRPADAVVPHPMREVMKAPCAAYIAFEAAVTRAAVAVAASVEDGA